MSDSFNYYILSICSIWIEIGQGKERKRIVRYIDRKRQEEREREKVSEGIR